MMTMKSMLTGAALAVMATTAHAATVSVNGGTVFVGDEILQNAVMQPGDRIEFTFTAGENFDIGNFGLTGNGFNQGNDLSNIQFGLAGGVDVEGFSTVVPLTGTSLALGFLPGASFSTGDVFTLFVQEAVEGGNGNRIDIDVSFTPEAPAPIPLPASGLLLLAALAGGSAMARRRKS